MGTIFDFDTRSLSWDRFFDFDISSLSQKYVV